MRDVRSGAMHKVFPLEFSFEAMPPANRKDSQLLNIHRVPTREEIQALGIDDPKECEYSLLYLAVHRGLVADVDFLLQQSEISLDFQSGSEQRTPLFEAVKSKNYVIARSILECPYGMVPSRYIEKPDAHGDTPLHTVVTNYAAWQNEQQPGTDSLLPLLLRHGANIDALNDRLQTPLHAVVATSRSSEYANRNHQLAGELLEAGAEVNTRDVYGKSIYTLPHLLNLQLLCIWLIASTMVEGDSPLHVACTLKAYDLVRLLVGYGADVHIRNPGRLTPLDLLRSDDTKEGRDAFEDLTSRISMNRPETRRRAVNFPVDPPYYSKRLRKICEAAPVYFRYQWSSDPETGRHRITPWVRPGGNVSDVIYPDNRATKFLDECRKEFATFLNNNGLKADYLEDNQGDEKASWRWINFPTNNVSDKNSINFDTSSFQS